LTQNALCRAAAQGVEDAVMACSRHADETGRPLVGGADDAIDRVTCAQRHRQPP
jgi:hypothetical protein